MKGLSAPPTWSDIDGTTMLAIAMTIVKRILAENPAVRPIWWLRCPRLTEMAFKMQNEVIDETNMENLQKIFSAIDLDPNKDLTTDATLS